MFVKVWKVFDRYYKFFLIDISVKLLIDPCGIRW